jgi:hypothetical protein
VREDESRSGHHCAIPELEVLKNTKSPGGCTGVLEKNEGSGPAVAGGIVDEDALKVAKAAEEGVERSLES